MVKKSEMTNDEMKNLIKKITKRFSLLPIFLGLLTLLPAGTFNYWQAYVNIAVMVVPMMFVLFYFLKNDPQFLERRIKTKEKEKAQRIIQPELFTEFFFGRIIKWQNNYFKT